MASKRPVRKKGESIKEYRARVAKWEAQQAGNLVRGAASAVGNFLWSKPKAGEDKNMNLTAWRENNKSGTNSITGQKTDKKKTETTTTTSSGPKNRPEGATGGRGRGTSTYTVAGITYDTKTGRPVVVPKNRQPVKAQDRTKKDTTSDSGGGNNTPAPNPPRNQSGSSDSGRKPKPGQGSQGFRKGDKDLGKATGIKATGSKPDKPKSRLEKALSGIGKWEEPKEKPKRNKPTSRFLKRTNNTRCK